MGAHTSSDDPTRYRIASEVEAWKAKDPISRLKAFLAKQQLADDTFFAEIELSRDGGTYRISSRPSDAIALAVRYGDPVPIFAHEDVLEEAGVLFEQDEDEEQIEQFREFLDQVRPEDFAHDE